MNEKYSDKIYGLNSLRGIAALIVVIGHVPLIKTKEGIPLLWFEKIDQFTMGDLAVTFFFVLSGFLITYLLLTEQQNDKNISIIKFYQRRVLRIWPVYYLLLIMGLYVLPYIFSYSFPQDVIFYELNLWDSIKHWTFFPNIAKQSNPFCFQSWSIGIEEQFYILFPLLIYFLFRKSVNVELIFSSIIIAIILIRLFGEQDNNAGIEVASNYLNRGQFDAMLYGAIAGSFFFKKSISLYRFRWLIWIVTIALFFKDLEIGYGLTNIIYGVMFSISILVLAQANLTSENNLLDMLGKYSYGLYMYHVVAIYLMLYFFPSLFVSSGLIHQVLLYVLIISSTILVSHLSYRYFERPILAFKKY